MRGDWKTARAAVPAAAALIGLALLATAAAAQPVAQMKGVKAAPKITKFTPAWGWAGETVVVIKGTGLTGASAVTFNGTPAASFAPDPKKPDKQLTATVATGTTTGPIVVTLPGGPVTSRSEFVIVSEVDIGPCVNSGSANVPASTSPYFETGWDMMDSSYLKPFLKSVATSMSVNGTPVKKAGKYWDKKGEPDGFGGWVTYFDYPPKIELSSPGDTMTMSFDELVTKTFSDGLTTYTPGTHLLQGGCTIHAV